MEIGIYDENTLDGCVRYIRDVLDVNERHRIVFMTDHFQKAIRHYSAFKEIVGDCISNRKELEIIIGDIKVAFRAVKSDVDKDHFRYAGSMFSELYFDRNANFTSESFAYLINQVRTPL